MMWLMILLSVIGVILLSILIMSVYTIILDRKMEREDEEYEQTLERFHKNNT
jgi:predicted Holliday junction resolvase-like endonuclease